jgi:hypothetical protein
VGADGALWFVEADTTKIGRITTAGSFTQFPAHNNAGSGGGDITAGPDGNLWFTEPQNIGRMTTAGRLGEKRRKGYAGRAPGPGCQPGTGGESILFQQKAMLDKAAVKVEPHDVPPWVDAIRCSTPATGSRHIDDGNGAVAQQKTEA